MSFRRLLLLLIGLFLNVPGNAAASEAFRAGVRHLPQRLDPRTNQVNTDHYILLHAYFPLFERNETGKLDSQFLDLENTKAHSSAFKSYSLCLKKNLKYSDGSRIQLTDLELALKQTHNSQEVLPKILSINKSQANCLTVSLEKSDPSYFDKFLAVSSTIIKPGTENTNVPTGLGPFKVTELVPSKIVLSRSAIKGQISQIEFYKFSDIADMQNKQLDDWNHIYQIELPANVTRAFQRIDSPFKKSYALIVNLADSSLRSQFFDCLPLEKLKIALGMSLRPTPCFLPVGMLGYDVRPPAQNSANCKNAGKRPHQLRFLSLSKERTQALNEFFSQSLAGSFQIKVEAMPANEMVEYVYSGKPYAAVIGFDSSGSQESTLGESSIFFESFVRESRLIKEPLPELQRLVLEAAQARQRSEKASLYGLAHRNLLDTKYVVPIGQLETVHYYPKKFSNIVWADRISGFPKIQLLKVRQ